MSHEEMVKLATAAVERHIGDVADENSDLHEEAYTLAFDAIVDAGFDTRTAGEIAIQVAAPYPG